MVITQILLTFGIYNDSASQIPCATYEHSMINRQSVRRYNNIGIRLTLNIKIKKAFKFLFINLFVTLAGYMDLLIVNKRTF